MVRCVEREFHESRNRVPDEKMVTLEQRVQERWTTFEDKWSEKVVHHDEKEAVIWNAEFRIRLAAQQDGDERWKKRMANEDKITTNAIETLRYDFNKMSAKIADDVNTTPKMP